MMRRHDENTGFTPLEMGIAKRPAERSLPCHPEPFGFAQDKLRRGVWHRERDASCSRPDSSTSSPGDLPLGDFARNDIQANTHRTSGFVRRPQPLRTASGTILATIL